MHQVIAAFGLLVMIGLAWLMSSDRSRFPFRVVAGGLFLQVSFALLILRTRTGQALFEYLGAFFTGLLDFVDVGSQFVFGDNFGEHYFAFKVLPTIIFFSALMSVLYHLGVMQFVVRILGVIMQKTLGTSGAESLSAAANIFVGQTEAPLVIRPYLPGMTRSEMMAVMVGGFSTVAGGVMAAYVGMKINAAHLMTASVISAPAALVLAKVMQPETGTPETLGVTKHELPRQTANLIEAVSVGASDGLKLALNVGAMLIAFLGLIRMIDFGMEHTSIWLSQLLGFADAAPWTLSRLCGVLFSPFAWLIGIEWSDCQAAGELLGLKMVSNEFVAYQNLSEWIANPDSGKTMTPRSIVIITYALCGFSNFASIGIQVGGIGGIVPERRTELTQLGLRAMLGGTLACLMTACVAGIVMPD
ncbi:MAG: NupC/NupG family nucleoside CNT transporter [Planctomycetaceae bacterium]